MVGLMFFEENTAGNYQVFFSFTQFPVLLEQNEWDCWFQ